MQFVRFSRYVCSGVQLFVPESCSNLSSQVLLAELTSFSFTSNAELPLAQTLAPTSLHAVLVCLFDFLLL